MSKYIVKGNDIANMPQGKALAMVIAELRVISTLLHALVSGEHTTELEMDDMRRDAYIEPVLVDD